MNPKYIKIFSNSNLFDINILKFAHTGLICYPPHFGPHASFIHEIRRATKTNKTNMSTTRRSEKHWRLHWKNYDPPVFCIYFWRSTLLHGAICNKNSIITSDRKAVR